MTGSKRRTEPEHVWLRDVGIRVRLGRVARRESQDQLGARAGVSRATVGSVERGDHPAAVTVYVRLARALGLPLDELLAGALTAYVTAVASGTDQSEGLPS